MHTIYKLLFFFNLGGISAFTIFLISPSFVLISASSSSVSSTSSDFFNKG